MTGVELGLPLAAIQRVELVRGAASSTYGSNALLGAIHVVTATGATSPGLRVSATTTATAETYHDPADRPDVAFHDAQLSASYGTVTGDGTDIFAAASYLRGPGLSAIYMPELAGTGEICVNAQRVPVACDGVVRDIDHEEAGSAYLAIHRGGFRLSGLFSSRVKQVPTAAFDTVIGDPDLRSTDNRLYLDAGYHAAVGSAELDARVAWDRYDYHGSYPYYTPPADGDPSYLAGLSLYRDAATADWFTGEARARWRLAELGSAIRDIDTVAGTEIVAVPFADQDASDRSLNDSELQLAGYAQAEARIAERIVGSAGTRVDIRPGSYGASTSSRLGLVVDPWRAGIVRLTYGTAFRAPNLYERYYYSEQAMQPALQPERATTTELSIEQYLGDHLRVIVAGYHNDLHDLIALAPLDLPGENVGNNYVFRNGGSATGNGVETELEARWQATRLRANLAVQRSRDADGQMLPNSPETLGNVALTVPLAGNLAQLAIASSFVGRRLAPSGAAIDAAFRTDLAIEVPQLAGTPLALGAGISNAFDQRSAAPGSEEHRQSAIPEDPRLVWIRIGARL